MNLCSKFIQLFFAFFVSLSCKQPSTTLLANSDMEGTIRYGSQVTFESFENEGPRRNDIVLFDSYVKELKKKLPMMLRVVGLPGDKIEVRRGDIYVNDKVFVLPPTARFSYYVKSSKDFDALTQNKYASRHMTDSEWIAFLNPREAKEVAQLPSIDSFSRLVSDSLFVERGIVAASSFKGRNVYHWGPYHIPKKGEVIDKDLISVAPNYLEKSDEGGKVKHDYYFLVTDNQFAVFDSRYLGLIPDNVMKGKLAKVE